MEIDAYKIASSSDGDVELTINLKEMYLYLNCQLA